MAPSDAFKRSAFAPETDDVWLVLLRLSHSSLQDDIRVVNNNEDVTSRGQRYLRFPFNLELPDSNSESPPVARLTIGNVGRDLVEPLRELDDNAIAVEIDIVRAAAPDVAELEWRGLRLRRVRWDATSISGELTLEDLGSERFPSGSFTPTSFPGVF